MLGAVLNYGLGHQGSAAPVTADELRQLLQQGSLVAMQDADVVRAALQGGLHLTFWGVLLVTLAGLAVAALVPQVALRRPLGELQTAAAEEAAF